MKIVVTGAKGLLGWHCAARLHAANCAAAFRGEAHPYELVQIDRHDFADPTLLTAAVANADAVIHFAGVNRAPEAEVEAANPSIARQLIDACRAAGSNPHIVYANSIHNSLDTAYGRSKRIAGELFAAAFDRYTDLLLPNIFGECARPDYNNVTATLIDRLWKGVKPTINPDGEVPLLHAGVAATTAINAVLEARVGQIVPAPRRIKVIDLYERLHGFHTLYQADIFPDLSDEFDVALFNSYRTGGFPAHYPRKIAPKVDARGVLFETAKSHGRSQTFVSTTHPGQLRGDHFHTGLVERFLVVQGRATIRIRKVLSDEVHSFDVDGDDPAAIDMPPLHTHHIENTSDGQVTTFFWAHRLFDPKDPDTFADPVLKKSGAA